MTQQNKLEMWKERAAKNASAWETERAKMDSREKLYRGERDMEPFTAETKKKNDPTYSTAFHVRNIVAENVESMVDSNIPQPKVTPRRKEDEKSAELIENMIRDELDRRPMEEINDVQERTVPIQGASFYLVEWDSTIKSRYGNGEVVISAIHPKQVIPQDGVTGSIEDMDYIILMLPQTRAYIRDRYGKDVDAGEEKTDVRGLDDEASTAEDIVTQYKAYYRDEDGNIGVFSWVGDTVLEDLEDYQARRRRRCVNCGEPEPLDIEEVMPEQPDAAEQMQAQKMLAFSAQFGLDDADDVPIDTQDVPVRERKKRCPKCGGDKFETAPTQWEEIYTPILNRNGLQIPGEVTGIGADGRPARVPTRIPVYKPNMYPIVMQKNVSVYGKLLGDSDVDKIADQQNALNWIQAKVDRRMLDAGTIITMPPDVRAYRDPDDNKVYRVESPADAAMIGTHEFTGNDLPYYFTQLANDYEAARQILGITDSFQGRRDTTATSGTAKQFAAAQSAGRLESKRRMKQAAYARLFELIFKFRLAYADEPRPVVYQDNHGDKAYDAFYRYDFLEAETREDGSIRYFWNDDFLFSCDTSAPLASNREALWQEARMNFQTGAYGNPQDPNALILFWTVMEDLHYPLAADAKRYFQDMMKAQQAQNAQAAVLAQQAAMAQGTPMQANAQTPMRNVPLSANGA